MVENEKKNEIKQTQFEIDLQSTKESQDDDCKTTPQTIKYLNEVNSKLRSQSSGNNRNQKLYQNVNKEELKRDTRIMYVKRKGNKVIVNNNIETVS